MQERAKNPQDRERKANPWTKTRHSTTSYEEHPPFPSKLSRFPAVLRWIDRSVGRCQKCAAKPANSRHRARSARSTYAKRGSLIDYRLMQAVGERQRFSSSARGHAGESHSICRRAEGGG